MSADPKGLAAELVARALAAADVPPTPRADRPVGEGDLYALPEAGDFAGEWAVLARHPERADGWLVVPADTQPVAGAADVKVPADSPAGPLTLRTRYGVWVAESALRRERWGGAIEAFWVRRARQLEAEGDGERELLPDPDLEEWLVDGVAPAREALARSAAALAAPRPRVAVPARRRVVLRRFAQAAAALLLVGLGGFGGWIGKSRESAEILHRQAKAQARERSDLGGRLSALTQEKQALADRVADLGRKLDEARRPTAFVSVVLPPEETYRGVEPEAGAPPVPPGWAGRGVSLELPDYPTFARYRVDIERGGRPILSVPGEARGAYVSFVLPAPLAPGEYRLHLQGLGGPKPEGIADYRLPIVVSPPR